MTINSHARRVEVVLQNFVEIKENSKIISLGQQISSGSSQSAVSALFTKTHYDAPLLDSGQKSLRALNDAPVKSQNVQTKTEKDKN